MAGTSPASMDGSLNRLLLSGQETITATIDNIQLPFENELRQYVKVDDTLFDELIVKISALLDGLKDLTVSYTTFLLNPSLYNDAYASSILTQLSTTILANLVTLGSGLPTATEQAIYDRATGRVAFTAGRTARRVSLDISKRLPYAGMIADVLLEADRDYQRETTDIARDVTYKQADLAYQNQIDKIKLSLDNERMNIEAFERRRDRSLRAYIGYDENQVRDHWQYFAYMMDRAINYAKICAELIKIFAVGADQLTFENWFNMSKIMADGQIRIAGLIGNLLPSGQALT